MRISNANASGCSWNYLMLVQVLSSRLKVGEYDSVSDVNSIASPKYWVVGECQ